MRTLFPLLPAIRSVAAGCMAAAFLAASVHAQGADDGLKHVEMPGGGKIVYGPVQGQTTMPGAMAFVLHSLHNRAGERPRVGRFFRTTDGGSVGTFLTVTDKAKGGKQIVGMILVTATGGEPEAAVISDDTDHFATSIYPMLDKLNEVWKPKDKPGRLEFGGAERQSSATAAAEPLHPSEFPDKTGSIGLPDGWKITDASLGSVHAAGPGGEDLYLGFYVPVADSEKIPLAKRGKPLPGGHLAARYGDDAFKVLVSISAQLRAREKQEPVSMILIRRQETGDDCTLFELNLDRHDGTGAMDSLIRECMIAPRIPGLWGIRFDQAILPRGLAEKEMPTIQAMAKSYKTDETAIRREAERLYRFEDVAGGFRDPVESGSPPREDKPHDARPDRRDSLGSHDPGINFSDYVLEDTSSANAVDKGNVVADSYAEALIKAYPERYEFLADQDFLKGLDY